MEAILKAILEANTFLIALLSGIFGAVITALLSYLVRAKLATREYKNRERRIAYIYLVKISQVVASEIAVKDFFASEHKGNNLFAKFKKEIKSISSTLEIAHAVCVILGKVFTQNNEVLKEVQKFSTIVDSVEQHFNEFYDFKIPDALLAQFPRDAISHYFNFIGNVTSIRTAVLQWSTWAKTGDGRILSAEVLFSQYLTFKNLLESARKLHGVLIAKGHVSIKEAETLLKEQKKKISMVILETQYANKVMAILAQSIFKNLEKHLKDQKQVTENVTMPNLSSTTTSPPTSNPN